MTRAKATHWANYVRKSAPSDTPMGATACGWIFIKGDGLAVTRKPGAVTCKNCLRKLERSR